MWPSPAPRPRKRTGTTEKRSKILAEEPLFRQKRFPRALSENQIRMEEKRKIFRASLMGFWRKGEQFIVHSVVSPKLIRCMEASGAADTERSAIRIFSTAFPKGEGHGPFFALARTALCVLKEHA